MTKKPNALMIARKWKEIIGKHKEQEKLLLELMCNPDATPEHIAEARESYIATIAKIREYRPRVEQILRSVGYRMF